MSSPDIIVEARGVLCPVPIIRLARTARTCEDGTVLALLTDDPAAVHDVPAWCRMRGHELLSTSDVPRDDPAGADAPDDAESRRGPHGPEPDVPNTAPGQSLRHLIRVSKPAP